MLGRTAIEKREDDEDGIQTILSAGKLCSVHIQPSFMSIGQKLM